MDKVYLVYKDNGESYEDYSEWVEYVTTSFKKAEHLLINDGYSKTDEMRNMYVTRENEYYEDFETCAWIIEKELIQ